MLTEADKYHIVADNTYDFEFWVALDGRFLYASPSCERITGHKPEEFLADSELQYKIVHPDDRPAWDKHRQGSERLEPGEIEFRIVRPDGDIRWIDHVCQPVFGPDGTFLGTRGSNRDITIRKQAELKLAESREEMEVQTEELAVQNEELSEAQAALGKALDHLHSVLGSITEAYVAYDRKWRILEVNPVAEQKVFQRPASELLGKVVWDEFPQAREMETYHQFRIAFEENRPVHFDAESGITSGWFEVHAYPSPDRLDVYFHDITERKRAEEEIRRLASFPELNPNPIVEVALNGEVTYQNPAAQATFADIARERWQHPALSGLEATIAEMTSGRNFDTSRTVRVGERHYLQWLNYVPDERRIRIYMRDVTERVRGEEQLAQSREELEVTAEELRQQNDELLKAHDALRASEERFRSTMDNMLEGCQIIGLDWRYVYINAAAERHNRRPRTELIGQRYMDMWPGIESTHVFDVIKRCREERKADTLENEFVFPDGKIGWFDLSIQPVPEGVFILSVDVTERKRAEESVRYQALLLENINDAVYGLDNEFRITHWNRSAEAILGWTAEEVVGREIRSILKSEMPEIQSQANREKMARGEPICAEVWITGKPGNRMMAEIRTQRVFDPRGRATGSVVALRDISERKQAEQKLQQANEELEVSAEELTRQNEELLQAQETLIESEQRFRSSFDEGAVPMALTSPDLKLQRVNPAYCRLVGYTEAELVGRSVQELTHPEDRTSTQSAVDLVTQESARSLRFEKRYITKDGRTIWVDISSAPVRDTAGRVLYLVTHVQDITERKRAEQALRESEEKYRNIVETGSEGIWVADAEARTTFVNRRMADMMGYTTEEMLGKLVYDFMDDEAKALARHNLERRQQGLKDSYEQKYIRKDGTTLWAIASAAPLRDAQGRVIASMGMLTDITERKEAEEKVRRSVDDLRAANKDLERFNRLAVERELRMVELKKEVNGLRQRLSEPPRYTTDAETRGPGDAETR
jgi:PAS domain S-box-containing protein